MTPRPVAVTYQPHCDLDGCVLGVAEYTCPWCGMEVLDYNDGWWNRDEPDRPFPCDLCREPLQRGP